MEFKTGVKPAGGQGRPPFWFAFRGDKLLVEGGEGSASVPRVRDLGEIGLLPLRSRFLGTADGEDCFAAELGAETPDPAGHSFVGLRQLFGALDDGLFRIAGRAFQVLNWDKAHSFCGSCGAPARDDSGELAKVCTSCGKKSFPRISPAVIVAVTRGGKLLLARARRFPVKLYSVIAGFVEPGETLEECVLREVREETGVGVKNLRYFGSQPWPFPDSLMVAFTAEHADGEIAIDEGEILDAGWFGPDALPPIPDRISIARRLIDWFTDTHRGGR